MLFIIAKIILVLCTCTILAHGRRGVTLKSRHALRPNTVIRPRTTLMVSHTELAISILAPSSLGFWKREYGVSYGYGGSVAAAAALAYRDATNPHGRAHAILHIIYGLRLCIFLFVREVTVPRFKEVKENIEKQSPNST